MNKIIIDKELYNKTIDEDLYFDIKKDSIINLKINKNNKILLFSKNNKVKINIELFDNSKLELNTLGINSNIDYEIILHNNSNLLIVDSIITNIDSINNIKILDIGNNNNTKFYINGINLDNNKLYFNINGIVDKNSSNSYLEENSKIINILDGDSKIIPNLIIDTKDVIANHSAYIGTFDKDNIYYLMSRGIDKKNIKFILIKAILLSNMNLDTTHFIKEIMGVIKDE